MQFIGSQPTVDLTYSDVFLVPRHSEVTSRLDVDLAPHDGTPATIPLVASNMNSVTRPRLAATMARRGGLGVLPQDLSHEAHVEAILHTKSQPVHCDSAIELPSHATAAEARRLVGEFPGRGIAVIDDGSTFRGLLSATRLGTVPIDARLGDLLLGAGAPASGASVQLGDLRGDRASFDVVHGIAEATGAELIAVLDEERCVGTITPRSALRSVLYRPALDTRGRLAVAAAVGINGDVVGRARALVEAGADALVIDTAHGHQEGMMRALAAVAALDLGVPLVAGNVVTADGAQDLIAAGANIVKVGVGPGAMCTTRMMTAVGRPQFSAVLEAADAARDLGAHVWADGGVRYPRDVALALAAGAASVMIGSWFAGTIEAPGQLVSDESGRLYKESWGMASTKAVQARFERLEAYDKARKELFAEGISSSKIYLDPLRPSVEDLLDMITSGVRSSCTYAGAADLSAFHGRALVGLQSAAGYEEGKALPVSW